MSENKCCKCGKNAEFSLFVNGGNSEYYCRECALKVCYEDFNLEIFRVANVCDLVAKVCDWCEKPLPAISFEVAGDSWYCSEECAIQGCGLDKIQKE